MQFKFLFAFALIGLCSARPHHHQQHYNSDAIQQASSVAQSAQVQSDSAVQEEAVAASAPVAQSASQSVAQEAQSPANVPAASESFAVKSVKAQAPQEPAAGVKSVSTGAKSSIKSPAKVASEIAAAPSNTQLSYSASEAHHEKFVHAESHHVVAKAPVESAKQTFAEKAVEQPIVQKAPVPTETIVDTSASVAAAPTPVVTAPVATAPVATAPVATAPVATVPVAGTEFVAAPVPVVAEPIASAPIASPVVPVAAAPVEHIADSIKIVEPAHKEVAAQVASAPITPENIAVKPETTPIVEAAAAPVEPAKIVESAVFAEAKPEEKPAHYSAAIENKEFANVEAKPFEAEKNAPVEATPVAAPTIENFSKPVEEFKSAAQPETKPFEASSEAKPSVYAENVEQFAKNIAEPVAVKPAVESAPVVAQSASVPSSPVKEVSVAESSAIDHAPVHTQSAFIKPVETAPVAVAQSAPIASSIEKKPVAEASATVVA